MEQVKHHITCETNGQILGYRDLVKMDAPVWTNSMCKELGRPYQGRKAHVGTESNLSSTKTNQST